MRWSASSELLTASESSIGNSGGTTEVRIIVQCSSSRQRERVGSCSPSCST